MDKTNPEKRKTLRKSIDPSRTGQIKEGIRTKEPTSLRTEGTNWRAIKSPGKKLPKLASLKEETSREKSETGKGAFLTMLAKRKRTTNRGLPPSTYSESSGNRKERKIKAPHKKGSEREASNPREDQKENFCLKRLKEKIKKAPKKVSQPYLPTEKGGPSKHNQAKPPEEGRKTDELSNQSLQERPRKKGRDSSLISQGRLKPAPNTLRRAPLTSLRR